VKVVKSEVESGEGGMESFDEIHTMVFVYFL